MTDSAASRIRHKQLERRLAQYGMAFDDYTTLLREQNYRCWICRKTFGPARVPAVDHSHDTGRVRGLLCLPCNYTLGQLHDDKGWLLRAWTYLAHPPADRFLDTPSVHIDAPPEGTE